MLAFFKKLWTVIVRLKGGANAVVAMPFRVKCECGHRVKGVRRSSWIEAECPECCQSVFILPANVYPATKKVPSSILGGGFAQRLRTTIADVFPSNEAEPKAPKKPSVPAPGESPELPVTDAADPDVRSAPIAVRKRSSKTFTPFRLVMLTMITIVGLTGYWMIHQQTLEDARQTWLTTSEQIPTLVKERRLEELETVLEDAVRAGHLLGRNDDEWRLLKNLKSETHAVNSLSSSDLLSAFHNVYDEDDELIPSAADALRTAATSDFFVIDSYLKSNVIDEEEFLIEFPALPGRLAVEMSITLPAISDLYEAHMNHRVLFAATIIEVEIPAKDSFQPWRLVISPDSFVLITSPEHCETLGFAVTEDDELASLLNRQKQFVEESEAWEHRIENLSHEEDIDEALDSDESAEPSESTAP